MKRTPRIFIWFAVPLLLILFAWLYWKKDQPRQESLVALSGLNNALQTGNGSNLLNLIVMPTARAYRTPVEQTEFLLKALRDEVSPEGLAALQREGQFEPLTNLLETETAQWATQARVQPSDCVTFKTKWNGMLAEIFGPKPPYTKLYEFISSHLDERTKLSDSNLHSSRSNLGLESSICPILLA